MCARIERSVSSPTTAAFFDLAQFSLNANGTDGECNGDADTSSGRANDDGGSCVDDTADECDNNTDGGSNNDGCDGKYEGGGGTNDVDGDGGNGGNDTGINDGGGCDDDVAGGVIGKQHEKEDVGPSVFASRNVCEKSHDRCDLGWDISGGGDRDLDV
jgi:hypothetical protein